MTSALDMQRARASAIARELVSGCPDGSIACVFAGGSLARGEVWAADVGGVLEVYSDVDLYVIVRSAAETGRVRSAAQRASADAPGIDGVRFLRPPDIGVYTRDDLGAQPARPGTVDLAANHVLLYGDAALPQEMPARDAGKIAAAEALYLLENRAAELAAMETGRDGAGARLGLVAALKARLDVHAAHAIASGSFVPTLAGRAGCFAAAPPPLLNGTARDDVAGAYRAAAKLAEWFPGRDVVVESHGAQRALSRAWRTLAPAVLGASADARIEALVATRCRAGALRANARDVIRLRRAGGLPRWRAMVIAPGLSRLSPVDALRLDALVRQFDAEGAFDARDHARHRRYVDRLTREFGFITGSLKTRVHCMHRAIA